jgi:hypothetical protein
MDLKGAALFAAVACMLNTAGLVINYGTLFISRAFHPNIQFFVLAFTSILTYVALSIFFFTLYGKQN